MGLFMEGVPAVEMAGYMQTFMTRQALARAWAEFQRTYPLVLAPIATEPPFLVGADLTADGIRTISAGMAMVVTVNLLGLPSVAVPVGVEDGLPQAVQVIGPRFGERSCLAAAEAIEDACGILTPIDPR